MFFIATYLIRLKTLQQGGINTDEAFMTIIGDKGELEIGLKKKLGLPSNGNFAPKGKYVFQVEDEDVGYINEVRLVVSKIKTKTIFHNNFNNYNNNNNNGNYLLRVALLALKHRRTNTDKRQILVNMDCGGTKMKNEEEGILKHDLLLCRA